MKNKKTFINYYSIEFNFLKKIQNELQKFEYEQMFQQMRKRFAYLIAKKMNNNLKSFTILLHPKKSNSKFCIVSKYLINYKMDYMKYSYIKHEYFGSKLDINFLKEYFLPYNIQIANYKIFMNYITLNSFLSEEFKNLFEFYFQEFYNEKNEEVNIYFILNEYYKFTVKNKLYEKQ